MDSDAHPQPSSNGGAAAASPPYASAYAHPGTPGYPAGLVSPGRPRHAALPPIPASAPIVRRVALMLGSAFGLLMIANSAVNVLVTFPGSPDRLSPASLMALAQMLLGPLVSVIAGLLAGRLTGTRRAGWMAAVVAFALGYVAWVALGLKAWPAHAPLILPIPAALATTITLADFVLLGLVGALLSWFLGRLGAGFTIGRYAAPTPTTTTPQ